MIDIEKQKKYFGSHIAQLTDYGNIKILDFGNPDSSDYRIRFIFEEDHCTLHISGDLGYLSAHNYCNMVYDKFNAFVNDPYYFMEKVQCHNRAFFRYDDKKAHEDILNYINEYDLGDSIFADDDYEDNYDDAINRFIEDVLSDFSDMSGISQNGISKLEEYDPNVWESASDFGKEETGIVQLYMLAFKLAQEYLEKEAKSDKSFE